VRHEATRRGLEVIDGTCPLVARVHAKARRYAARADTVVLVGHAGHEEVEGTLGEAPQSIVLVETADDVARLSPADPSRVSYLTQTTLAVDETTEVVNALRQRFPLLSEPGSEDICYATTNRQQAVREIARDCDLVLVVGSANSSNSLRLVEVAQREGASARLIEDAGDLTLTELSAVSRIGVTAGASAPPHLVDELISALGGLGPLTVQESAGVAENLQFTLPREVT